MASRMSSMFSNRRKVIIWAVAIVLIIAVIGLAAFFIHQGNGYVKTDNARISAPLVSVSTMNYCQVIELNSDLGDFVKKGQQLAQVGQLRSFDTSTQQGLKADPLGDYIIESPIDGYVAAVWTYPGATLGAGSQIVTLFDSCDIWVTANIDENDIRHVHPGQQVDVTLDCLGGAIIKGKVQGIAPATAASFSLLSGAGNTDANFTKVAQVVPIKITLDTTNDLDFIIPGTSVEVKIKTR